MGDNCAPLVKRQFTNLHDKYDNGNDIDINTLGPKQNGQYLAGDIYKYIFSSKKIFTFLF